MARKKRAPPDDAAVKSRRTKAPPTKQAQRARESGLTQAAIARLLGVSRESLRAWTLAGCPRLDSGLYVVAEVVTWLRKRERELALAEQKPDGQKISELNRKLSAEANLKELQLERERGLVIDAAVADERIGRIVGGFNAVASGRLTRFEREIRQCTTAAEARRITERIRVALMEGAHELADELDAEAVVDEAVDAA